MGEVRSLARVDSGREQSNHLSRIGNEKRLALQRPNPVGLRGRPIHGFRRFQSRLHLSGRQIRAGFDKVAQPYLRASLTPRLAS